VPGIERGIGVRAAQRGQDRGRAHALVLFLAGASAQFFPDWSRILIVVGIGLFGQ
jgi:hypothetical protein